MAHDRLRRFLGEGAAAGRYELGAPLGEGGMGAVFEGWDPKLERRVALKLFKTGDAERIRREAAAAARLAHPGIVAIYEVGPDFIAMEAIAGPTLAVAWPTMSPPERLRVLGSVADAVAYAHAAGVVHGDLKPSNVLLRHGHEPVLTDFGLARGVDGEVAEIPGGTLPHLAPEVLRGERRSPRNDVWSLGVMTYELLAGRRPFAGETAAALAQEIAHATPETFRHRCVPVILRALARAPADRFADAGAFAQALRAASDEPARAPAPTRVRGRAIWLVGALFAGLALWRVMAGTPTDPGGDPRLGAYREEERRLTEVLARNTHDRRSLIDRGEVRRLRGEVARDRGRNPLPDWAGAVADFTRVLTLTPGDPEAALGRGVVHAQSCAWKRMYGQDPAADCQAAEHDLGPLLPRIPRAATWRGNARFNHGLALVQANRRDAGLALLAAAESDFSHVRDADTLARRGRARAYAGRLTDAEADFAEAARLAPPNPWTLTWWGAALRRAGRGPEAIDKLSAAPAVDPSFAEAYAERGQARLAAGDAKGALGDFEAAIRHNPVWEPILSEALQAARAAAR